MLPISVEEYRAELHRAAVVLRQSASHVDVRGNDAASFVFAENERGAVEISRDDNEWWLEFWLPNIDEPFARKATTWKMAVDFVQDFLQTGKITTE